MTPDQYRRLLAEGTRTAKIATVRKDGRPHLAPVWFVLDGENIVFTTDKDSVKGQTLIRDGRVSVCVDDETFPYALVIVEGTAQLSEDPDELVAWATRIAARYVGKEQAEDYGKRNGDSGVLLVRVPFEHVIAIDKLAG
jgi:PPOX class probable F420-dependent enzyme